MKIESSDVIFYDFRSEWIYETSVLPLGFVIAAQGIQPLISTFYGVGNNRQAKTVLNYAVVTVLSVSFIVYLLIFAFAQPITAVFNSENNMELQKISVTGLKLYFISIPFVGYNIVLATFFTSIEKALPAHILSILRGLILVIPMAFLLSIL